MSNIFLKREDFTVLLDNDIVSITTKLDAWGGNE